MSGDLTASKRWYVDQLGWDTEFDSDWFVHLEAADSPGVELGLARHHTVPEEAGSAHGGTLLTFVVDDVDSVHEIAIDLGHTIAEQPTDLFYGQRRTVLVVVSSECAPSQEFLDSLPHLSED